MLHTAVATSLISLPSLLRYPTLALPSLPSPTALSQLRVMQQISSARSALNYLLVQHHTIERAAGVALYPQPGKVSTRDAVCEKNCRTLPCLQPAQCCWAVVHCVAQTVNIAMGLGLCPVHIITSRLRGEGARVASTPISSRRMAASPRSAPGRRWRRALVRRVSGCGLAAPLWAATFAAPLLFLVGWPARPPIDGLRPSFSRRSFF